MHNSHIEGTIQRACRIIQSRSTLHIQRSMLIVAIVGDAEEKNN